MAYSLINFSAVGFDAVRIPHGDEYARILLTALTATDAQIRDLAARHPGQMREKRWAALTRTSAERAATLRRSIAKLAEKPHHSEERDPAAAGIGNAMTTLQSLHVAPIGSLNSLDRLIRDDLLDRDIAAPPVPDQPTHDDAVWGCAEFDATADDMATPETDSAPVEQPPVLDPGTLRRAADVLVDAATASFLGSEFSPDQRAALQRPYLAATVAWADKTGTDSGEPPQRDWGNTPEAAIALTRTPEHVRIALHQMAEHPAARHRGPWTTDPTVHTAGTWAPAMNQACWAVHFSRRHRTAAAVQLLGALAFREAGFTATDAAHGAWNAVSGTLQAVLVDDLLGAEHRAVLVAVWGRIMGPPPHSADFPVQ